MKVTPVFFWIAQRPEIAYELAQAGKVSALRKAHGDEDVTFARAEPPKQMSAHTVGELVALLGADGQPLVFRVVGEAPGNGPGPKHAFHFETQVVVQARRVMAMHDELKLVRAARERMLRAGLGSLSEVALGAVLFDGLLRLGHRRIGP